MPTLPFNNDIQKMYIKYNNYKNNMKKKTNGILSHEFNVEVMPKEPLLGIKFCNCLLVDEDKTERPLFRIEIGILFLMFSYTNVDYRE